MVDRALSQLEILFSFTFYCLCVPLFPYQYISGSLISLFDPDFSPELRILLPAGHLHSGISQTSQTYLLQTRSSSFPCPLRFACCSCSFPKPPAPSTQLLKPYACISGSPDIHFIMTLWAWPGLILSVSNVILCHLPLSVPLPHRPAPNT